MSGKRELVGAYVVVWAMALYRKGWPRSTALLLRTARAVGVRPLRVFVDGRDLG